MVAVERLQEQLATLPKEVTCLVDEVTPDFAEPDIGPGVYLQMVEEEIERVEIELLGQDAGHRASLQRLREMLVACSIALHDAGVQT